MQVEPALVNLKPREVANITWSLATVQAPRGLGGSDVDGRSQCQTGS